MTCPNTLAWYTSTIVISNCTSRAPIYASALLRSQYNNWCHYTFCARRFVPFAVRRHLQLISATAARRHRCRHRWYEFMTCLRRVDATTAAVRAYNIIYLLLCARALCAVHHIVLYYFIIIMLYTWEKICGRFHGKLRLERPA